MPNFYFITLCSINQIQDSCRSETAPRWCKNQDKEDEKVPSINVNVDLCPDGPRCDGIDCCIIEVSANNLGQYQYIVNKLFYTNDLKTDSYP